MSECYTKVYSQIYKELYNHYCQVWHDPLSLGQNLIINHFEAIPFWLLDTDDLRMLTIFNLQTQYIFLILVLVLIEYSLIGIKGSRQYR